MFFDEATLVSRKRTQLRALPPTPETKWRPPSFYPNLRDAIAIGCDFEIKEPEDFKDHGPGWARGKASIVGGAIDALFRDGSTYTEYRPIRHEVETEYNLDAQQTIAYWKDVLALPCPKFGANLLYDCGNALDAGIKVNGDLYDCQFAEALLREEDEVNLDHLGHKYLDAGKESNTLYQWLCDAYGERKDPRADIYRASPRLVGPYGERDAHHPRLILSKQWNLLVNEGLTTLFRMECDAIPMLIEMRKVGCRVDIPGAERMYVKLGGEIQKLEKQIHDLTGRWLNVNSSAELAPAYTALNIKFPLTESNNPSFTAPWLMDQLDPLSQLVLATRRMYKLRDTFIKSYILEANVNGRIHAQFHPLRGETYGTRTGRYSSSNPDLQNIPSRTVLGREIMKLFLPDVGHLCWQNGDYSQIEYRTFAHFAVGPGSDELRATYCRDPKTDYHNRAQKILKDASGLYIPRKAAEAAAGNFPTGRMTIKEFNFGLLFGQGLPAMCAQAHCDLKQGEIARDAYFKAMTFIKPSQKAFADEAQRLGYITTVMGRRTRFDLWEPSDYDPSGNRAVALPYNQAIRVYGARIKRAGTHRSLPNRVQGTAAEVLKMGMLRCWKEGVYKIIGVPKLTVHDAKGNSVIDDSKEQNEAYAYMHHVMETALPLRVPVVFEVGRGPTWGDIE